MLFSSLRRGRPSMLVVINIDSPMHGSVCGKVNCTVDGGSCCSHCSSYWSIASCSSRIVICAYPTCIRRPIVRGPRQNIAIMFGVEKLEWCGYAMVKKMWRYFYPFRQNTRTWRTNKQTDGRADTAWRHRQRLHSIERQKCLSSTKHRSVLNIRSFEYRWDI